MLGALLNVLCGEAFHISIYGIGNGLQGIAASETVCFPYLANKLINYVETISFKKDMSLEKTLFCYLSS